MEYYIAVFWSRTEAFSLSKTLKTFSVPSAIIPTPKEAGRTCGLSVKILDHDYALGKKLVEKSGYRSFGGWYLSTLKNGKNIVIKV